MFILAIAIIIALFSANTTRLVEIERSELNRRALSSSRGDHPPSSQASQEMARNGADDAREKLQIQELRKEYLVTVSEMKADPAKAFNLPIRKLSLLRTKEAANLLAEPLFLKEENYFVYFQDPEPGSSKSRHFMALSELGKIIIGFPPPQNGVTYEIADLPSLRDWWRKNGAQLKIRPLND